MRPIPVLLLLGLLPFAAARAAEPENAKPAEKPIDREEVQRLASQLDAEDSADREKATEALIKFGAGVVPFLLPALEKAGSEQAMRIKTVGRHWGFHLAKAPPSVNERLLELQKTDADVEKRVQIFDAICGGGEQGRAILQGLFEANGAKPTIEFDMERLVVTVGGKILCNVYLSNSGSEPYWSFQSALAHFSQNSSDKPNAFGHERPMGFGHRGVGGRRRLTSKPRHLMEVLCPVQRGAKGPQKSLEVPLKSVGIHKLYFSCSIPAYEMTHSTRDGKDYEFKVNQSLKKNSDFTSPSGSIQVFALPDFEKLTSDSCLAMDFALDKAPAENEKAVDATVTLRSKDNVKPIYLEENLALYAWYAVLDEKGKPVRWGSWHSAAEDEGAALKARKLATKASAEWKLKIPTDGLKPGTYRLVASYKAELYLPQGIPLPDSEKCMLWGDFGDELKEAKLDSVIRYESGELGAKAAQTFTIPAKEESEAKKP